MQVTVEMLARAEGRWHKSRFSGAQAGCVEVAELEEGVLVRDSKNRDGGILAFTHSSWSIFTESVK